MGKKDKVDVVGVAIDSALTDIRHLIGAVHSDDEMTTEKDKDYKGMNELKEEYLAKRRDSGSSINTAYK
jgi:hypothetical protein